MDKVFDVYKARKTLLVLDYVAVSLSGLTILIVAILFGIIRVPEIITLLKFTFTLSLIIFLKEAYNIKSYYSKKDSLYKYTI